jgi:hypothetical protein
MRHLLPLLLLLPSVAAAQDDWSTPAEIANFEATPRHMSTIIYLQLLDLQKDRDQFSQSSSPSWPGQNIWYPPHQT